MTKFEDLPRGGQALTAHLVVKDANKMVEFYKDAFGAEQITANYVPDSELIMHASMKIGNSTFFLNDEFTQYNVLSPATTGSTSSSIHIQVSEGLDELFERAVAAGATAAMPPADQFWGDRYAMVVDPSGHKWGIGMTIANPPAMDVDQVKGMGEQAEI